MNILSILHGYSKIAVFSVIHVNFHCRFKENNAEIALAEFTFEKGVERIYNQMINERVRWGYTRVAEDRSGQTHQIAINLIKGRSDYREISKDINEFQKNFNETYCKFSLKKKFRTHKKYEFSEKSENFFLSYPFEMIFFLSNNPDAEIKNEYRLKNKLEKKSINQRSLRLRRKPCLWCKSYAFSNDYVR